MVACFSPKQESRRWGIASVQYRVPGQRNNIQDAVCLTPLYIRLPIAIAPGYASFITVLGIHGFDLIAVADIRRELDREGR